MFYNRVLRTNVLLICIYTSLFHDVQPLGAEVEEVLSGIVDLVAENTKGGSHGLCARFREAGKNHFHFTSLLRTVERSTVVKSFRRRILEQKIVCVKVLIK